MTAKKEGQQHPSDVARAKDCAYFAAHPKALSHLRPYIEGEAAHLPDGLKVECVAVAFVSAGFTFKRAVLPGQDRAAARCEVEEMAVGFRLSSGCGVMA